MESYSLVASDASTDFRITFDSPWLLDPEKQYELALVSLETYNAFPNVNEKNNLFVFSRDKGQTWTEHRIATGAYEITDLSLYLKDHLGSDAIELIPNINTLKCRLKINDDKYRVSFVGDNTLRDLLGLEAKIYDRTEDGITTVNILTLNSILVHSDIIGGSYVNGQTHPTLYSFFPDASPGAKIVETPHNLVYLPVTRHTIRDIRLWLTSQNIDELLDLRGEIVTIRLHLRTVGLPK